MGALSELTLQTSYHKGRDNIAEAFYLPCMRRATEYDRAVGYFRSTAFIIAWPALREFVQRRGKIRVLCSQVLASDDIDALDKGYSARVDRRLGRASLRKSVFFPRRHSPRAGAHPGGVGRQRHHRTSDCSPPRAASARGEWPDFPRQARHFRRRLEEPRGLQGFDERDVDWTRCRWELGVCGCRCELDGLTRSRESTS